MKEEQTYYITMNEFPGAVELQETEKGVLTPKKKHLPCPICRHSIAYFTDCELECPQCGNALKITTAVDIAIQVKKNEN